MTLPSMDGSFRCVKDPTLRFANNGMAICSFTAVADKKKNVGTRDNPDWQDDKVIFVRVTCFKQLAEHVAESVVKGTNVVLSNTEVSVSEWKTDDGTPRTTVEVVANDIGVSLLWDTVTVHKAERGGGQSRPQGGQQGGQQNTQQPRQQNDNPWGSASSDSAEPPF